MPHLLHLDASARRNSHSRTLSQEFAQAWQAANPDGIYAYRDLAINPPPFIDQAWTEICDNLMAAGITEIERYPEAISTPTQRNTWTILEPLLKELVSANVILIGTPMYNYSIPAVLKAWLDQVTFPKMSLAGRSIVVVSARGGSYMPGTPKATFDYQERYLRDFFAGHFAITDVTFIHSEWGNAVIDPNLAKHQQDQKASHISALEAIKQLASTFKSERQAA